MKNNKLGKHTLVIDGNYFIHSRLFVLPRNKGEMLLGDHAGKAEFMRKLCIDFASETRKMSPFVDQIVLAVDSKSWRKDLFPDAQYKGTRTQQNDVNWESVFDVYNDFQDVLQAQGVIVNRIDGAEADDILFGWATHLNNIGKNCIVWTGDRDLIQLVNYNDASDAYTLWYYNSRRRLIAFEGFDAILNTSKTESMSNDDLLFNMGGEDVLHDNVKSELRSWIKTNNVELEEINCDDFIFVKILHGDKSDNIKSVVTWDKESASGKVRTYSITERVALNILNKYKESEGNFIIDHFFTISNVNIIVDLIHDIVGVLEKEEIRARFNQNLDLMLLHYNTIPDPIQRGIYTAIERDVVIKPNIQILSQMKSILEGTKWETNIKNTRTPKQFDPFTGITDNMSINKQSKNDLNTLF